MPEFPKEQLEQLMTALRTCPTELARLLASHLASDVSMSERAMNERLFEKAEMASRLAKYARGASRDQLYERENVAPVNARERISMPCAICSRRTSPVTQWSGSRRSIARPGAR